MNMRGSKPVHPWRGVQIRGAARFLAVLLAVSFAALAKIGVSDAGEAKKGPAKGKDAPDGEPKKEAPKKEAPKKPEGGKEAPKEEEPKKADEGEKLLAEKEKKRGPSFPGIDPAFLVLPRRGERPNSAAQLLTPQVREMTEKALDYLAKTQGPDGGWGDMQFKPTNTGVTALACLAFMAEGSRPRVGRFGKTVDRGLEFILKNVKKGSGIIAGAGSNELGPMYEHALSTLALLMASGDMPWKSEMHEVLGNAVDSIKKSQKLDGGWRYAMTNQGDSDMSVTANVLWVLRTAKKCGFTVPKEAVDKGVKYIEKCALPDGTFRYRYWGLHASPSLGGTGIIALCNDGSMDHPLIGPARDRIAYDYQRYTIEDLKARRYFVYGAFYASLGMYSCGDEYFVPWFRKAVAVLATMQRKDGEFFDEYDNTVYPTAMAAMILQVPLGYLPIYER